MQATVFSHEPDGTVVLVTDDGRRMPAGGSAFAGSGLRDLRPGQRLSVEATEDGRVTRAWIVGIGEGELIE